MIIEVEVLKENMKELKRLEGEKARRHEHIRRVAAELSAQYCAACQEVGVPAYEMPYRFHNDCPSIVYGSGTHACCVDIDPHADVVAFTVTTEGNLATYRGDIPGAVRYLLSLCVTKLNTKLKNRISELKTELREG